MIVDCPAGTDSAEGLVIRCPSHVSLSIVAVRMRQGGSTEVILQKLLALYSVKFVSIGLAAAVNGQLISVSATVEDSSFIDFTDRLFVLYVTVATEDHLHKVLTHFKCLI